MADTMSRFDPDKVADELSPRLNSPFHDVTAGIELLARCYRELYEAAEEMAELIEGFFNHRPDGDDLLDAARKFRGPKPDPPPPMFGEAPEFPSIRKADHAE